MRNIKSALALLATGFVLGLTAPKVVNYLESHKPEQPEVTMGTYQGYGVEVRKESDRSVVILTDTNKPFFKIHGLDKGNDGSIDMAQTVMGCIGTTNNSGLIQAAYDSVRKK